MPAAARFMWVDPSMAAGRARPRVGKRRSFLWVYGVGFCPRSHVVVAAAARALLSRLNVELCKAFIHPFEWAAARAAVDH